MGPLQFDWPWSATDLMKCYKDSGKGDESYPYFLRISELYPQNWGIWHALGVSKFTVLDEPEDAIKYYQKATQKRSNKGWVWSWFDMGLCFVKINKIDEAQNCFKKALENKPDCWEAYNQLARGAISLKRWGEVLDFIQKGLEIKQDEPELWLAAGDFFLGNHHPNSFFAWNAYKVGRRHNKDISSQVENLANKYQADLRKLMEDKLNIENDIRPICLDLHIKFENLEGNGLRGKVISLIETCEREDRIEDLVRWMQKDRPDVFPEILVKYV